MSNKLEDIEEMNKFLLYTKIKLRNENKLTLQQPLRLKKIQDQPKAEHMIVYIDIDIRVDLEICNHKIKDQEIIKIC